MRKIFLIFLLFIAGKRSEGAVFTVSDTTANSTFSFAFAIAQANALQGRDTIEFNIPGTQQHYIVSDSLPDIIDPLFINGLTQSGNTATTYYNTTLVLTGTNGINIHSPNCEILGLGLNNYGNVSPIIGITIIADSAKSISNTVIRRIFIQDLENGISIFPDSIFSLNSYQVFIDSCEIVVSGTGLSITSTATSDISGVLITNNTINAGYLVSNYFTEGYSLNVNRQTANPTIPEYTIHNNFLAGYIEMEGYLDSIYVGYNEIHSCNFSFSSASIDNSLIEYNQMLDGGSTNCIDHLLAFQSFPGDTIRNIRIRDNKIVGGNFYFDFTGNNQVFDSIFIEENNFSYADLYFQKNNVANSDTQKVRNIFIRNNYGLYFSNPAGWEAKFELKGLSDFLNIRFENNQMLVNGRILMQSDSSVILRNLIIDENNIQSNESNLIEIDGLVDGIEITNDTVLGTYFPGPAILFDGKITNLKIENNFISLLSTIHNFMIYSNGITFLSAYVEGEIKHNHFAHCTDAELDIYGGGNSNSVLEIDSNIFTGSYYYGIGIRSSPYNPPSQNIGRYTMLGNSIYNIGTQGIYRFSQHDTASCMTCIPKPLLLSAEYFGGTTSVSGTFPGDTLTDYIIEYFSNTIADSAGYPEGEFFIYRDTITTDASGNAFFTTDIPGNYLSAFITSTATSLVTLQTSEFSNEAGVVLGIPNSNTDDEFRVFPNPSTGRIFIYSSSAKINGVEVLDVTGKILKTQNGNWVGPLVIDLSDLSGGVYFLKLSCGGNTCIKKILKN